MKSIPLLSFSGSILLALAFGACSPSASSRSATATPAADASIRGGNGTEILWDTYGVPHIYAADRQGLAYAFGWAQMRNHADLMLRLVAQARGRASEYLGPSYLDEDRWVWTLDLPAHAERMLQAQPPDMRAHIEAFVGGINAFAREHPDLVSDSVRAVLPVTAVDIVAHKNRVQYARFITSNAKVSNATRAWERGSNAWAIAPGRSASGKSMLLASPHLPWSDFFTWTEAQYSAPGVNVYGAALVLSPVLQIAFNDALGWTHTVNTQDGEDLYELTLSGDGYLWNGQVRSFERREQVMRVRMPDGSVRHDTVRVRRSIHGPVVNEKPGKAIALAAVGLHGPQLPLAFVQWWSMGRAQSFDAFLAAIRPNQISGQNITYADRDGHIMMFYGGNTPIRPRGSRVYWDGIVPGDTSATLWTSLHGFDDMPKTVDPPSGYVQNTNDPPWWATFPPQVRPDQYPPYLATRTMTLRPQRSVRMLDGDSNITFEELATYHHSTRIELADRVLDDLLPAAKASPNEAIRRAAAVLEQWDRTADAASRGGVLFEEWWETYVRARGGQRPFAVPWSENAPRTTPDGLADIALALGTLERVADSVAAKYGAVDVPWGDVYRVRRDGVDLPASGARELGVFRAVRYAETNDGKFNAVGGTSYAAVIEFSSPVRARTIVAYGNASQTGSPHRTDQLRLFADKKLKPAWLTRREVERHLERRERFE
jgi:acyl-homoserine-lactone acylase